MSNLNNDILEDALTHLLIRSRVYAKIHKHSKYCGNWAIDTSGTGQIPFHLINDGRGWLHIEGCEPKLLQTGDLSHLITFIILLFSVTKGKQSASTVNTNKIYKLKLRKIWN